MLAQDKNLSANFCHNLALIFWPAVLQNMLYNVVTVLILQEAVEVWAQGKETFFFKTKQNKNLIITQNLCDILMHYFSSLVLIVSDCHASLQWQVDEWVTPPFVVRQIPLRHHCGRSDITDAAGWECCWLYNTTSSIFAPSEMGDRQSWV